MASPVRFPIRTKLLLLVSALILAATGSYLALALKLFKDDKLSLVYELNASSVKTLAAETEAYASKVADKLVLLAQGHHDEAWTRAILDAEPDLISYSIYAPPGDSDQGADWKAAVLHHRPDYLKLYGLEAADLEKVREQVPIPFAQVLAKRTWAANATVAGGAPLLTVALAVEVAPSRGSTERVERVLVADLRLDRLLKMLPAPGVATAYVVDRQGVVVAHPDASLVAKRTSLAESPIVREAVESPVATQLKAYDWNGERWLGAYSSVGFGGLKIISQVREQEAFRAAETLLRKSLLFALIVITAGLLISRRVARTVTEPVESLLEGTERLARGELSTSLHVRGNDEVARLARSFNAMASNLHAHHRQLESAQQELEIKVRERTEALEEERHRQSSSQDALLRTTRLASLGELAGSAAHEVLNPVNNMNIRIERLRGQPAEAEAADLKLLGDILRAWRESYVQGGWQGLEADLKKTAQDGQKTMLEEDLENLSGIALDLGKRQADRQEALEFLGKEITRITRIVNGMRSLSRVGGERRPLDIHAPIEDTAATLADILAKRKVALVREFGAESRDRYTVIADQDELVQVFSNLIRNSLHAVGSAKRRAPTIRVATRREGDRIEIRVSDNGSGIENEHLARVFEPDFTTKSVEEGTGLGLSISRRLVRAFGGDLEVERSVPGEGTTFLIWLPAAPVA